ncbi:MAG: FecR domain-containing protein [Elusimicrobia bacterium]|nr:FecR domain-containing protein [Elusimicrobiota bacterium]
MRAEFPRLVAASALLSILFPLAAFGQATVDSVDGKVEVAPGGLKVWVAVKPPYVLKNGDRVRTAPKASAKISFPDKSRVELGGDAVFGVVKVVKGDAALSLDRGVIKAEVTKAAKPHFRVTTPDAVATVHGTKFRLEVTYTRDTQVEVDEGVVAVKLEDGEVTELGPERPYRSLLVLPHRSLAMLPHPHEDAGGRKSAPGDADCLHRPNGALRRSVEAIETCQDQVRAKLEKSGPLSVAEAAHLREHDREEIRRFLTTTGVLDVPVPPDEQAEAPGGEGPAVPVAASGTRGADGHDVAAEHDALMKELGLQDNPQSGALGALTPEKIQILQSALAKQGASPAIQAALSKAAGAQGGMTAEQLQELMKSMKLDQINPNAAPAPTP